MNDTYLIIQGMHAAAELTKEAMRAELGDPSPPGWVRLTKYAFRIGDFFAPGLRDEDVFEDVAALLKGDEDDEAIEALLRERVPPIPKNWQADANDAARWKMFAAALNYPSPAYWRGLIDEAEAQAAAEAYAARADEIPEIGRRLREAIRHLSFLGVAIEPGDCPDDRTVGAGVSLAVRKAAGSAAWVSAWITDAKPKGDLKAWIERTVYPALIALPARALPADGPLFDGLVAIWSFYNRGGRVSRGATEPKKLETP